MKRGFTGNERLDPNRLGLNACAFLVALEEKKL